MANVRIHDNGAAYMITVDGMIVHAANSLGNAWRHIEWMYRIAQQRFTVGEKQTPVKEWLRGMYRAGFMDGPDYLED